MPRKKKTAVFAFYVSEKPGPRRVRRMGVNRWPPNRVERQAIGIPGGVAYLRVVRLRAKNDLEGLSEASPPRKGEQFMNTHALEVDE